MHHLHRSVSLYRLRQRPPLRSEWSRMRLHHGLLRQRIELPQLFPGHSGLQRVLRAGLMRHLRLGKQLRVQRKRVRLHQCPLPLQRKLPSLSLGLPDLHWQLHLHELRLFLELRAVRRPVRLPFELLREHSGHLHAMSRHRRLCAVQRTSNVLELRLRSALRGVFGELLVLERVLPEWLKLSLLRSQHPSLHRVHLFNLLLRLSSTLDPRRQHMHLYNRFLPELHHWLRGLRSLYLRMRFLRFLHELPQLRCWCKLQSRRRSQLHLQEWLLPGHHLQALHDGMPRVLLRCRLYKC